MGSFVKFHILWVALVVGSLGLFTYSKTILFSNELIIPILGVRAENTTAFPMERIGQPVKPVKEWTLEKIFEKQTNAAADTVSGETTDRVVLLTTGDIIPARSVNYISTSKTNFKWAFENVAPLLKGADITFVNMEAPLIKNCPLTNEGFIFCGDEKHLEGLLYAGVDIVNYANNHMGNYGVEGIDSTKKLLDSGGILSVGLNAGPVYKTVKGIYFAFLAYNSLGVPEPGLSYADKEKMKREINAAHEAADVVVVGMQWGEEYTTQVTSLQKELAHLAVDNGADLVIGNHPHWIQPIEIYKNKIIMYAHGNLIFDQMWSPETRRGVLAGFIFKGKELADVSFTSILIEGYGQPKILEGAESEKILKKLYEDSLKYKSAL